MADVAPFLVIVHRKSYPVVKKEQVAAAKLFSKNALIGVRD